MEDAALEQPWIILQFLMDYCSPGVPNIIDSSLMTIFSNYFLFLLAIYKTCIYSPALWLTDSHKIWRFGFLNGFTKWLTNFTQFIWKAGFISISFSTHLSA